MDDRVGNARAPHLVLRWGGTSVLRAPLSMTGELGGENGVSTTRRKVSAAVPGATTGTPRVASQTKQNKTSARLRSLCSNVLLYALQRFVRLNPIGSLLCLCDPLREGISKAHFPLFKPHLKGSARLQGFTLRGQYFFSRALQGFSKASLSKFLVKGYAREGFNKRSPSVFEPSSQALCKVCMPESNLCVALRCL